MADESQDKNQGQSTSFSKATPSASPSNPDNQRDRRDHSLFAFIRHPLVVGITCLGLGSLLTTGLDLGKSIYEVRGELTELKIELREANELLAKKDAAMLTLAEDRARETKELSAQLRVARHQVSSMQSASRLLRYLVDDFEMVKIFDLADDNLYWTPIGHCAGEPCFEFATELIRDENQIPAGVQILLRGGEIPDVLHHPLQNPRHLDPIRLIRECSTVVWTKSAMAEFRIEDDRVQELKMGVVVRQSRPNETTPLVYTRCPIGN